ncbi:hydroperoxide isomerase ALOXE3-like [Salarias fasciatus]|uniref:hydroperoxide isomerase ALOXE3-like n=1 Tax=Salarias fasciatus TaxID=181472 RepID=UPI001176C9BB|nr:hydroperoxide isomerase ALOXE3-like [Salarias fasciatus]
MPEYKVQVTTGSMLTAGTYDYIYATLIGAEGDGALYSERTLLDNFGPDFVPGTTRTYTVKSKESLGELLLLKLEKEQRFYLPEKKWFCSEIVVKTPEGEDAFFPCYRWISRGEPVVLRGGKAMKVTDDREFKILMEHRKQELEARKKTFKWEALVKGLPHLSSFDNEDELPDELRFSKLRFATLKIIQTFLELREKLLSRKKKWENFQDMKNLYRPVKTDMSDYVDGHWDEDDFFGYQFLNGMNPNVIQKCDELPKNFPVKDDMVKSSLPEGSSLEEQIKEGNIFLCDQKILDGIPGRNYSGECLKMTAALCLFYMNSEKKLKPIAIQLYQEASEENPIFLPGDKTDWQLAKMFVKNGDTIQHEAIYHLLGTHFLAESFAVATLRNFPAIHPLYKLLIPHFRFTMSINTLARTALLGKEGAFSKSTLGYEGMRDLMVKGFSEMTYRSLCLPENISDRKLESVPNFYYRDDGLKLWEIIKSFVKEVVEHYYTGPNDVKEDEELQDWIKEIRTKTFLQRKEKCPSSFEKVEDVVKFITMIIFTLTAQHAAVNNGQADFILFVPNAPFLMRKSPPSTKGQSDKNTIFETLPTVGQTAEFGFLAAVLSQKYSDAVLLGKNPKERFQEQEVKTMIVRFQKGLSKLSSEIDERNATLKPPYTYLNPSQIENSIAI